MNIYDHSLKKISASESLCGTQDKGGKTMKKAIIIINKNK